MKKALLGMINSGNQDQRMTGEDGGRGRIDSGDNSVKINYSRSNGSGSNTPNIHVDGT